MDHGLSYQFLYSAYKLEMTFVDEVGNKKELSGTGFWVKNSKNKLFFVTNRHNVDYGFGSLRKHTYTLRYLKMSGRTPLGGLGGPPELVQYFMFKNPEKYFHSLHISEDVVVFPEPDLTILPGTQSQIIEYYVPQSFLANMEDFKSDISVCDFVAFPGFSEFHDLKNLRPLLRVGTLSSDPSYDYPINGKDCGRCVVYEAFSYGGSSRSPVFSLQKGLRPGLGTTYSGFREVKLLGINAGHFERGEGKQHSGLSYFYKSSIISELIEAN